MTGGVQRSSLSVKTQQEVERMVVEYPERSSSIVQVADTDLVTSGGDAFLEILRTDAV